jgi:hypothetical protein
MRFAILPSALPAMATARLALTTGKSPEPVLIAIAIRGSLIPLSSLPTRDIGPISSETAVTVLLARQNDRDSGYQYRLPQSDRASAADFPLCSEKAAARILVYNTTPRFALWALPRENRLELIRELRPKLLLHEWGPPRRHGPLSDRAYPNMIEEVRFAPDSPLEREGFDLSFCIFFRTIQ